MKKIAVIGAGGFGQEVFCLWKESLQAQGIPFEFLGFFDDNPAIQHNGYGKVIGTIEDLNNIDIDLETVIAVGNVTHLKAISQKVVNGKVSFPNIIHPSVAFLDSQTFKAGKGNIFSMNCIFSCNVVMGDFNVFNTRSTLGHDTEVGSHNVFSPNAQISGNVKIGNQNMFGFNSGVIQQMQIGDNNTIGIGSLVIRNIKDNGTYFGLPAKKINF